MKRLIVSIAALIFANALHAGNTNAPAFPAEHRNVYRDTLGEPHVYLVQEPTRQPEHTQLLIYMHGAGGLEEQGMDSQWASRTFTRLRTLMSQWNWVYVCPRDAEFPGLLAELREKYRPTEIFLAGASAGGRAGLAEALREPRTYAGLILLCPAISADADADKLSMPVWIVTATGDQPITQNTRQLVVSLDHNKKRYRYVEIPGGDHGTPVREVAWEKALRFLIESTTPSVN